MQIPERESISTEFKSDVRRVSDDTILDAVVALANTDGGVLYLGVEDDGTPTEVHKSRRNTTRLAAFVANKTVPPVSVRVNPQMIQAKDGPVLVIAIEVPRSSVIVATASGKMLRRRTKFDGTPESVPLYPHEIVTRLSSLNAYDYSAAVAPDATLDDLDPGEIDRLQERIRSGQRADISLVGLSDEELLRALRCVSSAGGASLPTVAGVLMLGKVGSIARILPTHGAAFQVLEGSGVRVNKGYAGPLLPIIEDMEAGLRAWNPQRELFRGLYRVSIPEFSTAAVREGIVNAFGHRDYTMLGQVRVQIDDRGLTIMNPGGFVDGVTSENLLRVDPRGRNLCLMDALKRVGMAERTGRGADRIYEGSLLAGRHLPEWTESSRAYVSLYIPRGEPDEGFMRMLDEARALMGSDPSVWSMLALDALRSDGPMTIRKVAEYTHMSLGEAEVTLEALESAGLVVRKSLNGSVRYSLNEDVYGLRYGHGGVESRKVSPREYPGLVLAYTNNKGKVSTSDVANLLEVSTKQAYRILVALVDEGKLVRSGKGAGTKYCLAVN